MKAKAKPNAKKAEAKKAQKSVGQRARELLRSKEAMTYDEIAEAIRKEFGSRTSKASVQWYASKMRKEGQEPNVKTAA